MTFADLGLGPEILKAVEEAGYVSPTPIQEQAIPVILSGRDVLGVAQTGTGKTAGFTLPMIEILAGSRAKARMPRSLILAPTRELAAQVAENFEIYGKYHRLTMARLIGGESFTDQEKLLDRGVDVLVATPGRLMDLFDRGRILLNDVKVLVIDEADRMLDMGFIPDVERIVSLLPKIRQTLFFSATMAPEIRRLADAFLMNPKEISVARQASTASTVEQFLIVCDELDKRDSLRQLLRGEDVKSALIFCNRKRDVDILYRSLAKHGFDAAQLHGDMVQSARTETLERFKNGDVRLLVCSDVAARGIDISDLSHVFNFDVPHHAEDYVHRIGRTGRAGKTGRAFTFASPDDGKAVATIQQLIGKEIPRVAIEGLPELELDMEATGHRRGRGRDDRNQRGRKTRDRRREPVAEERPQSAAPAPAPLPAPAPEANERDERPRQRPERDRSERPERDRNERSDRPRNDGGDRNAQRGRNNRGERPRRERYRDEYGIGETNQPDNVIGFGDAIPDFLARPVPLPKPSGKGDMMDDDVFDEEILVEDIDIAVPPSAEELAMEDLAVEIRAAEILAEENQAAENRAAEYQAGASPAPENPAAEERPAAQPKARKSPRRKPRTAKAAAQTDSAVTGETAAPLTEVAAAEPSAAEDHPAEAVAAPEADSPAAEPDAGAPKKKRAPRKPAAAAKKKAPVRAKKAAKAAAPDKTGEAAPEAPKAPRKRRKTVKAEAAPADGGEPAAPTAESGQD